MIPLSAEVPVLSRVNRGEPLDSTFARVSQHRPEGFWVTASREHELQMLITQRKMVRSWIIRNRWVWETLSNNCQLPPSIKKSFKDSGSFFRPPVQDDAVRLNPHNSWTGWRWMGVFFFNLMGEKDLSFHANQTSLLLKKVMGSGGGKKS